MHYTDVVSFNEFGGLGGIPEVMEVDIEDHEKKKNQVVKKKGKDEWQIHDRGTRLCACTSQAEKRNVHRGRIA